MADPRPYKNEFVTLGDLSANVRVAALPTLRKKSFAMYSGEDFVREIRPVKFEGARSLA